MAAGVLVLQYIKEEPTQKEKLAVFLLRNKKNKKYMDGGGMSDGQAPHQAASRELLEESVGLIHISAHLLKRQPYVQHKDYRVFVQCIDHPTLLNLNIFYKNQRILRSKKAPRAFQESDSCTYVFVQQLLKDDLAHQKGDMRTRNYQGENIQILGRTKACLRKIFIEGDIDATQCIRTPLPVFLLQDTSVLGFSGMQTYTHRNAEGFQRSF